MKTAEQEMNAAIALGLSGQAASLFVKKTAGDRHNARVCETARAARDVAREWTAPTSNPSWREVELTACLVLQADLHGVGGRLHGATGEGTDRLLSGLGKGRWNACDGPAYKAAAIDAMHGIWSALGRQQISVSFFADWKNGDDAAVLLMCGDVSAHVSLSVLPPRWWAAIAASVITDVWPDEFLDNSPVKFSSSEDPDDEYTPSLSEWGALFNFMFEAANVSM